MQTFYCVAIKQVIIFDLLYLDVTLLMFYKNVYPNIIDKPNDAIRSNTVYRNYYAQLENIVSTFYDVFG